MRLKRRCKYYLFLIVALILGSSYGTPTEVPDSHARDLPLPANLRFNSYPDPAISFDSSTAALRFFRAGNLILLKAKADTTEGYFILDTGAPYLILNMTYFRDYPSISFSEDGEQGGITGAVTAYAPTKLEKFSLGPFHYHNIHADRINLGHIESVKGVKIFGLLGLQLFKKFEMIIDYETNTIYLHLISKKEAKTYKSEMLKDATSHYILPFVIQEHKMMVKATFGTKSLTFIIDTGAESNVIDSRLPNSILEAITVSRRVTLRGNGGAGVEALYGDISDLKIGDIPLGKLPVLVTNLEKMCSAYNTSCLDGMLGFDFLSQHKIGFNFVNRKMYIWK